MLLEINGKSYELHFGMKALEIFFKSVGVIEEGSLFHPEQLTAIVWGGLQNAAYRQHKTLTISFSEVVDWVDEQLMTDGEALNEAVSAFNDSQAVQSTIGKLKEAGEEVKKKKRKTSLKKA